MCKYLIRLDDAAEKMDIRNWDRMEKLLSQYRVRPLVGVIPDCKDSDMDKYETDPYFWDRVFRWQKKGWFIALHGYEHKFVTDQGGINPVNNYSEFAGLPYEQQKKKIARGMEVFKAHGIEPCVFFAPAHTFDKNTIRALLLDSPIRIISDTVANQPYTRYGITFIPQQSGRVRKLPFKRVTFCYHPNNMKEKDFIDLERFVKRYKDRFMDFPITETQRKIGVYDKILQWLYFMKRRMVRISVFKN